MTRKLKSKSGSERRVQPRLMLAGGIVGTVQTAFSATIIDLSMGGAQLDVAYVLKPGGSCLLGLPLDGDEMMKLQGRVLRSTLHAFEPGAPGEKVARYRVAIQFVGLTDDQRTRLEERLLHFEGRLAGELAVEIDVLSEGGRAEPETVLELEADLPPDPEPADR